MKIDIKNYTLSALKTYLETQGLPRHTAQQVFVWMYNKCIEDFDQMTDVAKASRTFLKEHFCFSQHTLLNSRVSSDGTEKFLLGLTDGYSIETAFIPETNRCTICLSTQVGCKYSCAFCLSGKDGFKRNLTVSEIINQYLLVQTIVAPRKITNIVFMGVGEPLDNFDNTIDAIRIFIEGCGFGIGKGKISLSTCGLIPELKRLYQLDLGIKVSVSLHAPTDELRSKLMPVNKKYPLKELIETLAPLSHNERYAIIFEYVLLSGVNAGREDAVALVKLLRGVKAKVNLLAYNKTILADKAPSPEEISAFKEELIKRGMFVTLRKSRGQDIGAACGQLLSSESGVRSSERCI